MPRLLFADAVQVAVLQALAWTLYGGGHAVLLCAAWTRKQPEDATWQDRASAPGLGLIASALVSGVQVRVRQQTCHGMYYYWPVALDSGSLAIVAEVGGPSASQDEIASAFAQPKRQRSYDLEVASQAAHSVIPAGRRTHASPELDVLIMISLSCRRWRRPTLRGRSCTP